MKQNADRQGFRAALVLIAHKKNGLIVGEAIGYHQKKNRVQNNIFITLWMPFKGALIMVL